jgi:hypothetical protein
MEIPLKGWGDYTFGEESREQRVEIGILPSLKEKYVYAQTLS